MAKVIGNNLRNIPFEEKPKGYLYPVWRYSKNPIIGRNPAFGVARIFNSAVAPYEGGFIGVFRAENRATLPHLRVGRSKDGINWEYESKPIEFVQRDGSIYSTKYLYDPRLVKIDDVFHIVWCTDFHGPALSIATTKDFKSFEILEQGFLPFNRNGVLFPRKVNGKYLMLSRPSDSGHTPFGDIFISESTDLVHWGCHKHVMGRGGHSWWQDLKIGAGPIPIETDEGWLLFYHGVTNTCNGYVYSMGVALLDINEPWKVLFRAKDYVLSPETTYEETGFVPNVVFPCATLHDAETGNIAIYYGAADSYVALAFTNIETILKFVKENNEIRA